MGYQVVLAGTGIYYDRQVSFSHGQNAREAYLSTSGLTSRSCQARTCGCSIDGHPRSLQFRFLCWLVVCGLRLPET